MRDAFVAELLKLAHKDPKITLVTGDLGFGVFNQFREELPEQFLNVGVAEQNMTSVAAGLALEGRIVFTYSIANFVTLRCLEQLRNDVFYHDLNVNAVCIGTGFTYGALGMSHHATEDISIMRSFPDITIMSPGTVDESAKCTLALAANNGPGYLRLDKSAAVLSEDVAAKFQPGKALLIEDGSDVTLASTGGILSEVLEASKILREEGISAKVLHFHTIKPLDREALFEAVTSTNALVSVEEHTVSGGFGSLLAEELLENGLAPKSFHRVGLRDGFSSIVGSQQYLRTAYKIDRSAIVEAAKNCLSVPLRQKKIA